MVTVWERLGESCGQPFENNFGVAGGGAFLTWTRALSGFSETAIRAALDLMKGWEKPFPPTLGEFVGMVRSFRPVVSPDNLITHNPRASRETGDKYLGLMRRIQAGDYPSEDEIRNAGGPA